MRSPKPRGEVRFLGGLLDFEERLMRSPSLEMIDRLAEALGISPRKLLRAEP